MKPVKVLPVYPEFPDTFWSYKGSLPLIGRRSSMPPNGLLTVMGMLPEENFEPLPLVDVNVEPLKDEHLDEADIVFTSAMLVQSKSHEEIVRRAHERGKKVVTGGPFVTSYPDMTQADYGVTHEAEVTLAPFIQDLLSGEAERQGRRFWTEGSVQGRVDVPLIKGKPDITGTPLPRWDLVDLGNYAAAAVQYSRGCPFRCDFCDITPMYGRTSRTKTPEQMEKELDALYEQGHRGSVFIVDDNFIGNGGNVRELLPALARWQEERRFPFGLFTEASMNLAWDQNKDILRGMNNAGFDYVFLGIESIDPAVLKQMQKTQNVRMNTLDAVRAIQRGGLEVSGGFIVGTDGETPAVFDPLYEFIQEAGIPIAMPGLLTAIRGTDLYKRLQSEGRLRYETSGNNTHTLGVNFVPTMDEDALIGGYRNLLDRLYSPGSYYERSRTLMDHLGENKTNGRNGLSRLEGLAAFARSLAKQVRPTKEGAEYLKHLAAGLVRGQLPKAVAQAIKYVHFNDITKKTLAGSQPAYVVHPTHEKANS